MNFSVKKGYLLVTLEDSSQYKIINDKIECGKVAVANEADLGIIVFFNEWERFTDPYVIVKVEDILVWIKPDAPKVKGESKTDKV